METQYNVCCWICGKVWQPKVKSSLWWQAKKRADQGYLDALHVEAEQCGCQYVENPDAPYRVTGYTDMCDKFDKPFDSFVEAVRCYLRIARERMSTVYFIIRSNEGTGKLTRVQKRLLELSW